MGGAGARAAIRRGARLVRVVVPWLMLVSLVTHLVAHAAITVGLARRPRPLRALLGLLLPPLAPWWAWEAGMRTRAWVWLGALAVYALGVAFA